MLKLKYDAGMWSKEDSIRARKKANIVEAGTPSSVEGVYMKKNGSIRAGKGTAWLKLKPKPCWWRMHEG